MNHILISLAKGQQYAPGVSRAELCLSGGHNGKPPVYTVQDNQSHNRMLEEFNHGICRASTLSSLVTQTVLLSPW